MKKYLALILVLVSLVAMLPVQAEGFNKDYGYWPGTVVLMDPDNGQILFSRNPDVRVAPASTTKLMTALLVLENVEDFDQVVTVSEESLSVVREDYDSHLEPMLVVGEEVTLRDLFYGMLLPSGSDCASTLAAHVGGTVKHFVEMMNQKAQELGMTGSHFSTPQGYPNPDNYTTALDMSIVARELMKNEFFMEVVGTKRRTMPATNKAPERELRNTNYMVEVHWGTPEAFYEYATGMKTGSSDETGGCLVSTAHKDGEDLLCIIYQDKSAYWEHRWLIAQDLFEWGFTQRHSYDGALLRSVSVPMTELLVYGTPAISVEVDSFSFQGLGQILPSQISAKLILDSETPAASMTGKVEYWHEDGIFLGTYPAKVSIANFAIPVPTTEPTEPSQPAAPSKPEEKSPAVFWICLLLAVALFVVGGGVGLAWYSGYRTAKAKQRRIEKKILYLRARDPEDPALVRLENIRRPAPKYDGLYLACGLAALGLVLLVIALV